MSLKFENWDGVTAPAIPTGWTADSPAATTSSLGGGDTPISSPNVVAVGPQGGGAPFRYVTWGTADSNGGDVSVTANFNADNSSDRLLYSVFARCNASAAVRASSTFYAWECDFVNNNSKIVKDVAGTVTGLSTIFPISLSPRVWYQVTFTLQGTSLTLAVQRLSDNKWLNSSGSFQSGQTNAHSITDFSISGAGYAGLALSARSDTAYADDWTLSAVGGSSSSASIAIGAADDAFAGSGRCITAAMAKTEAHDVLAGSGSGTASASLARTEGHDLAALTGRCITAAMGQTELGDTAHMLGLFGPIGTFTPTETADQLAGTGFFSGFGHITRTEAADLAALVGKNGTAAYLSVETRDIFAGAGVPSPTAFIAGLEAHDVFAGSSSLNASAHLGVVEGHDVSFGGQDGVWYHIYSNNGIGDPIDYTNPIANINLLTWTIGPLSYPGVWRFGVRPYDTLYGLEEENLDCAVTLILDAAGVDITNRPKAPTALRAIPRAGGTIRVEWAYNTINPQPAPTGFHIYKGTSGIVNYASPAATVSFAGAIAGSGAYMADLVGLTDDTTYTIGVRAFNGTAEEPNTVTVSCAADASGPAAVHSLTATAI
jgi:hypothetical protein